MKLMAADLPAFNDNEELVLEALSRSKISGSEASDLELSNYAQSLSVEQIAGLKNNVNGEFIMNLPFRVERTWMGTST